MLAKCKRSLSINLLPKTISLWVFQKSSTLKAKQVRALVKTYMTKFWNEPVIHDQVPNLVWELFWRKDISEGNLGYCGKILLNMHRRVAKGRERGGGLPPCLTQISSFCPQQKTFLFWFYALNCKILCSSYI